MMIKQQISMVILLAILLICVPGPAKGQEVPPTPSIQYSGRLVTVFGEGVSNRTIYVEKYMSEYQYETDVTTTDSGGYWTYDANVNYDYKIWFSPNPSEHHGGQGAVICDPGEYVDVTMLYGATGLDFIVNPWVKVAIDTEQIPGTYVYTRAEGTMVFANGRHVGTVPPGENQLVFFPDNYGISGEGTLTFGKNFHKFSPTYHEYNCRNRIGDYTGWTSIDADPDIPFNVSWGPGTGMGFNYFPLTPDNRIPNNPFVFSQISFPSNRMFGTTLGQNLYMNSDFFDGVHSSEDLSIGNGFRATFEAPISGCGRGDIRFYARILVDPQAGGSEVHYLLLSANPWFSSTSNIDLNGDFKIDLGDNSVLASCIGSCTGDSNYLECADFWPDSEGCIDLNEIGIYATAFFNSPAKSYLGYDDNITVSGEICTSQEDGCEGLSVFSDSPWDAAVVLLNVEGLGNCSVQWNPSEQFVGKSTLIPIPGEPGQFGLLLFGPVDMGEFFIGQISSSNKVVGGGIDITIQFSSAHLGAIPQNVIGLTGNPIFSASAFPNPFNPKTNIKLSVKKSCTGVLAVYSIDGKLVKTLKKGEFSQGNQEISWEGDDLSGRRVASGNYFFKFMSSAGDIASGKLTLLK